MTDANHYAHGEPCWVDTWQPDAGAAAGFYGPLFGWQLDELPTADGAGYYNASIGGKAVAGIGAAPPGSPAAWAMYIRVESTARAIEQVIRAGGAQLIGTRDLADQGRMAILTDSTGVAFGTWEPHDRTGAQITRIPNSWAMSALHTSDLTKAERFYRDVFGWELARHRDSGLCEWRLDGHRIAVAASTDGLSTPPHWAVNFAVGDVDAFAEHARRLGANLVLAPVNTPGFRNAVISDPQGAVFAVSAREAET